MQDRAPDHPENPLVALSDSLAAAFEALDGRVVAVHGRERGAASGILWRSGVVVTAEEALERDGEIDVTLPDGSRARAVPAGRDATTDVAALTLEGAAPQPSTFRAGDIGALRPGALVLAAGRREDGALAARLGVAATIGPAWRSMAGGEIDRLVTLDIALDRAGEGGAVADAAGRLLGMAVLGPRRQPPLVIPAATIDRVVDRLLAHGRVGRGYLGIGMRPVRLEPEQAARLGLDEPRGVIVIGVDRDGPARAAGVLLGDVITGWDGEPVRGVRELVARLGPDSVGRTVRLGLLRAGAAAEAALTVAERPGR